MSFRAAVKTLKTCGSWFFTCLKQTIFLSRSLWEASVVHTVHLRPVRGPRLPSAALGDGRMFGHLSVADQRRLPPEEDGMQAGEPASDLQPANAVLPHRAVEVQPRRGLVSLALVVVF